MIRYTLIEFTEDALPYFGYAKRRARQMIHGITDKPGTTFHTSFVIEEVRVRLYGYLIAKVWVVKMWMVGTVVGTVPLLSLGSTTPLLDSQGGNPEKAKTYSLTVAKLLPTLLKSKSISYVDPYIDDFISGQYVIAASLPGITNVSDSQAGSIAVSDLGPPTEFDFDGGKVWAQYSPNAYLVSPGVGGIDVAWTSLVLPTIADPSTAAFDMPTNTTSGAVVDGTYTLALPMAEARFTLPFTVTIVEGKITTSTATSTVGQWKYTRTSCDLISDVEARTAKVTVVYEETYNNKRFHFSAGVRTFSIPASGSDPGFPPPSGNLSWNTYLRKQFYFPKFSTPNIAPAFGIERTIHGHAYTWDVGLHGLETRVDYATWENFITYSNGTEAQLSSGGPTGSASYDGPYKYGAFGQNGEQRITAGTYADGVDPHDYEDWVNTAGVYDVKWFSHPSGTFYEKYEIVYGGVVKRTALGSRSDVFGNSFRDGHQTIVYTDAPPTYIEWEGLIGWNGEMYVTPDESVSIAQEVIAVMAIDIKTVVVKSITVALLPFGWGQQCTASFRHLESVTTSAATLETRIKNMRDEMQTCLTLNTGFTDVTELQKHVDMLNDLLIRIQGTLPPGATAPTMGSALQELIAHFTPFVQYLSGKNVSERVALAAGTGTFLSVAGAT